MQAMLADLSPLAAERTAYRAPVPAVLASPKAVTLVAGDATVARSEADHAALKSWFPHSYGSSPIVSFAAGKGAVAAAGNGAVADAHKPLRVAICFNGRQTPGGHNLVAGLFDYLKALNPNTEVLGVLGGSRGLFDRKVLPLTEAVLAPYRNQGGFALLGRSVDKIRSAGDQAAALASAAALGLDGLVLVGGTYTNTDAAHLAEHFAAAGSKCRVVGVPVTIDGDVRNQFVEATLGFDTATKTYAQLVGNMLTDNLSAKKYYYWIRLMGRTASHITAEVALGTHPNVTLLGEEIEARKQTLTEVVSHLADVVAARAAAGKNYGVMLVPEGIVGHIPELRGLISEMNGLFREGVPAGEIPGRLTPWAQAVLAYLPPLIRDQLFLEREASSGGVQLSQISSEKLLAELVGDELARRKKAGAYAGKYAPLTHFFGYQSRSAMPSNFDCAYGSTLGATAGALVAGGYNGYMATVRNLAGAPASWAPVGVPLTAMMTVPAPGSAAHVLLGGAGEEDASADGGKRRPSSPRPVIDVAPLDIHGSAYRALKARCPDWVLRDVYSNPGPIQFDGPGSDDVTFTLLSEKHDYIERIAALREKLAAVAELCRPGVSEGILDAALTGATSLARILAVMKERE